MAIVDYDTDIDRVFRVIGQGVLSAVPGATIVQRDAVFQPAESDLPLVRLYWADRFVDTLIGWGDRSVGNEAAVTDFSGLPWYEGEQEGEASTTLVDSGAAFSSGASPVTVGAAVKNVTSEATGEVTALIGETSLETDVEFAPGDGYAIYWPNDILDQRASDRKVYLGLDLYAHPHGDLQEGGYKLSQVEQRITKWFQYGCHTVLNAEEIEFVDIRRMSDSDEIIATGMGSDFYRRAVYEVELNVGDGGSIRKGTVEVATHDRGIP